MYTWTNTLTVKAYLRYNEFTWLCATWLILGLFTDFIVDQWLMLVSDRNVSVLIPHTEAAYFYFQLTDDETRRYKVFTSKLMSVVFLSKLPKYNSPSGRPCMWIPWLIGKMYLMNITSGCFQGRSNYNSPQLYECAKLGLQHSTNKS